MSSVRARRNSRSPLPTPENTMRFAGMPAARGAQQFAFTHHVGTGTFAREQPQYREPIVRLHGIVDVRVEIRVGQRRGQHAVTPTHGGGGIHPHGRSGVVRDGVQRHVVHHQPIHGVHGQVGTCGDQLGGGWLGGTDWWGDSGCHADTLADGSAWPPVPARRWASSANRLASRCKASRVSAVVAVPAMRDSSVARLSSSVAVRLLSGTWTSRVIAVAIVKSAP